MSTNPLKIIFFLKIERLYLSRLFANQADTVFTMKMRNENLFACDWSKQVIVYWLAQEAK